MTVQDGAEENALRREFTDRGEAWHAARERALADPHGFLAVTSLRRLDQEPARFPDAPGGWSVSEEGVVVGIAVEAREKTPHERARRAA